MMFDSVAAMYVDRANRNGGRFMIDVTEESFRRHADDPLTGYELLYQRFFTDADMFPKFNYVLTL